MFEVADTLCPWNDGRWQLKISDDGVLVERSTHQPELMMPVDTLAMLIFGQISPTQAVRMGRAEAFEGCDLFKWDRVMQTRHKAFCPDFF